MFCSPTIKKENVMINSPIFRSSWSSPKRWKDELGRILLSFLLFIFVPSELSALEDIELAHRKAGFIVEVPYYCPPPKIQDMSPLIKEESARYIKKMAKNPQKKKYHELPSFKESDFIPGQEPYRIAEDEFRGFLKLRGYQAEGRFLPPSRFDNPRAHEHAKAVKETSPALLKDVLEKETSQVNSFINLFRTEAFGHSAENSKSCFDESMKMVLLLNRYKSISSTLNKSLKLYSEHLDKDKNVLFLRGFWEPKWQKKINGVWKTIKFKEVQHYFIEYLKRSKDGALKFLKENEGGEINGEQKGRIKGIFSKHESDQKKTKITMNTHVPYQELREALRTHPLKKAMVQELKNIHPGKPIYEAIHDSDLVGLRLIADGHFSTNPPIGLYSHYELLIEQHKQPNLLTTGYRAARDERFNTKSVDYFVGVYSAIEEDRYVRAALSLVDARLAYYSEPNFLVKIPSGELSMPYSFMDKSTQWSLGSVRYTFNPYNPHESLNILEGIYTSTDGNPHIVFDPKHPILMRLPDRMLVNKHSGTPYQVGHYDENIRRIYPISDVEGYSFLKLSENVSQSPLSFRDYSLVAYTQLGLKGGQYFIKSNMFPCLTKAKVKRPHNVFISLLCTIFNSYDPVMLIENLHLYKQQFHIQDETLASIKKRIDFVCEHYEELTKSSLLSFGAVGDENVSSRFKELNRYTRKVEQLTELREIFNPVFQTSAVETPMSTLIEAAQAMGKARNNHIKWFYGPLDVPNIKPDVKPIVDGTVELKSKKNTKKL